MGFWQQVKGWLSSEAAELKDAASDFDARADRALTARERQLDETPVEAMERLRAESAANDSLFDELEGKIAASQAKADAVADLAADGDTRAAQDTGSTGDAGAELIIPESETEEQ